MELPRPRSIEDVSSRHGIRSRANQIFRGSGIWPRLERRLRVDEFTNPGDPLRFDYGYRRNGTRGFVQAMPLARDPGQAKLFAYTAGAIRNHVGHAEFLAVTEREVSRANPRDQFVSGVLEESGVRVLPLAALRKWAHDVAPVLRANGRN